MVVAVVMRARTTALALVLCAQAGNSLQAGGPRMLRRAAAASTSLHRLHSVAEAPAEKMQPSLRRNAKRGRLNGTRF